MYDMGLRPDKPHMSSVRGVVGRVMGLLHPHGDTAMRRLGAARPGLVDAAADDRRARQLRFAGRRPGGLPVHRMPSGTPLPWRWSPISNPDTVDFRPNYDGKELEPSVLPAAFPNLLVNGASVAVGMATNLAPHNLIEVVGALKHLLAHPDADLDALMRYIPGPDFPTGGTIIGLDGVRDAYASGRGSFKLRCGLPDRPGRSRRKGIVVTSLPYGVGPEKIMEQIKDLVTRKLSGIADVKDLTDLKHGTRLVIEIKNGINPDALLAQQLQADQARRRTSYHQRGGSGRRATRTMSLIEMLQVYLGSPNRGGPATDPASARQSYRPAASGRGHAARPARHRRCDRDHPGSEDVAEARTRLMERFDDRGPGELHPRSAATQAPQAEPDRTRIRARRVDGEIARLNEILDNESVLHGLVELDDVVEEVRDTASHRAAGRFRCGGEQCCGTTGNPR